VTDKDGLTQITGRAESREVMSPQVAYIMTDMMKDVLDRGTGTRVRQMGFAAPAAGKTGSSRDAWFAGYTPNLVCVVWIGYDDNSDIGLTGGLIAAPIWADFMIRALRIRPELGGEFEDPGDLVTMEIDPASGAPAQGEARRRELFLPGTEPGGGQTLPDHSVPETEPPPSGGDSQRPPPPKPADSDRMATDTGGIDTGIIPLPPEARKTRPRPGAEPTPTPKQSFTGRVKEFFGFGNPAAAKTAPSPTPEATPRPAPKPASTPRPIASASTPKPIASDASAATRAPAATGTTRAAPTARPASPPAKPKPKPSPRPQVATRPRSVAEKKKAGGQAASKPKSEDRASKSDKDKKTSQSKDRLAAGKKDEKKSDKKAEAKPASKQPETKKPATQLAKASTPAPTPTPTPTPTPAPTIISTTPRGDGTFTLEVCAVSGLLPVPGLCKTVRQRFKLGFEPTKRCSQAHHRGN
jgi:membrane peptidoglycan carboxypeptidase